MQPARFVLVGLAATGIYLAAALALGLVPGIAPVAASVGAYAIAAVFSYWGHKRLTFRSSGSHAHEAPRFLLTTALGLGTSVIMPLLLTERLGLPSPVAVLVVCMAIPVLNYLILNAWVFRQLEHGRVADRPNAVSAFLTSLPGLLSLAILGLSLLNNAVVNDTHMDVSWLITVCERLLEGQVLYVDVWETNPPFSIFLYWPPVALAHLVGGKPEFWVGASAYLWVGLCLWLCLAVSRRSAVLPKGGSPWLVPVVLGAAFIAAPATFAQREFFAIFAALPMIALATVRLEARVCVPSGLAIAVGLFASLTMLVKPHYALAFALPYLFVAWDRRSIRLLFSPEILAAALVVILYGAAIAAFMPAFLDHVLPILFDIYVARRMSVAELLGGLGACGVTIAIAYLYLAAKGGTARSHVPAALAFAGFFSAYLMLGKGWDYHALPFFVTGSMALAMAGAAAWPRLEGGRSGSRTVAVVLVAFVALCFGRSTLQNAERWSMPAGLEAALEPGGSVRSVALVGSHLGLGHPMVRVLGARWVGRECSDWYGVYALERLRDRNAALEPEQKARLAVYVKDAVARKAADLVDGRPELIAVDHSEDFWLERLREDPAIADALSTYRTVGRWGVMEYLRLPAASRS